MVYTNRDNSWDRGTKTSNDRISRSYRSPPLSSRVSTSNSRYDEHRSRRDDEPVGYLSKFYRERFGSHSPEDYLNLRMSQFDKSLTKDHIRQTLEREFKALAPFEIKIVQNPDSDERLAYVNFERPECAKIVRRNMVPRLQKVLGRRIVLDPAGIIRDQEGKFIPDRYNRAAMAAAVDRSGRGGSPRPAMRRRSPVSSNFQQRTVVDSNALDGIATLSTNKRHETLFTNLNQDDTQASRTLFIGNLPGDVRETELKRLFEIYGTIENVDIKILQDSNAAFAFILYETVEEAVDAKKCQHNKPIRPGSSKCLIGYGKSQVSQRLYVGGLGIWASYDLLMSEFDRYGAIDIIKYEKGDKCAYIRYENLGSAVDACGRMKNFDLDGKGKRITVDFAKDDKRVLKRGHGSDSDDENDAKRRGPRTPSLSPGRSPTEVGYIQTLDELRDQVASTWKGIVTLKKSEYPLRYFFSLLEAQAGAIFYRVFGKEHLLQDMLRDDAGNALRLNISQRLPLDNAYYQRMIDLSKNDLALMIAVETNERHPVAQLVNYLQNKGAAGVIYIKGGNVHILSYSLIAERLLKFFSPRIALLKPKSNYLLIALKKNANQNFSNTLQPLQPEPPLSELPPPPPLPMLPSLSSKYEPKEEKMPLREDRSAIQLQLRTKSETKPEESYSSMSVTSTTLLPPPLPPQLNPPNGSSNTNCNNNDDGQSSSEGENDHRRAFRHYNNIAEDSGEDNSEDDEDVHQTRAVSHENEYDSEDDVEENEDDEEDEDVDDVDGNDHE